MFEEKIENWEEAMNRLIQEDGYMVFAWGSRLEIGSIAPDVFDIGAMRVVAGSSREEAISQANKIEQWTDQEIQPPPFNARFYRLVPADIEPRRNSQC